MSHQQIRDRYIGVLLGLAAGEAMGMPLSGHPRYEIEERYGRIERMLNGPGDRKAGTWGLATAQALETLESQLVCRGFEGQDVALRLVELSETPAIAFDDHTARAIDAIVEDPDAWETASQEPWYRTAGTFCNSGALTRASIAALAHPSDLNAMVEQTIRLTLITHRDPRCVDAAIALNFVLHQCLHDRFRPDLAAQARQFLVSVKKDRVYTALVMGIDRQRLRRETNYSPYPHFLEEEHAVIKALDSLPSLDYDNLGTTYYVIHALQTALWCALHGDNAKEAVRLAVSLGGDTPIPGALTGALAGARFGFKGLPSEWLEILQDRSRVVSRAELLASSVESTFAE